ncbi:class I SAM-dependent methyltransferase [Kitasatospora sp. NPDC002227]|uniref:class I SAM-dependent methyltransferase n=1 Tax=Kitasatospora sp. NPDC002227 TaxID=3154773 RepID=UPI0033278B6D
MGDLGRQLAYWDGAGAAKTFTHPVEHEWLAGVSRAARVLDYGCGYGRVMASLADHGFTELAGVDLAPALVARGRALRPDLAFDVLTDPPAVPRPDGSYDLVLLFAVLTCVPSAAAQRELIAETARLLAPGGLLYVSDLLLQEDERNRARYAAYADAHGTPYGVFETSDGAVCRHHSIDELRSLLGGFELVRERRVEVATMNGHGAQGVQLLVRAR